MSGTQHPRQHGSSTNNDASHSPASTLPETLRPLMRHSPDPSRSHIEEALPALYTPSPGSSSGVQNLPPLAATIHWPPLVPGPGSDMRRTQQASTSSLEEPVERRYSPLSHRERIEMRASPDQVWPHSQRDDVSRPTAVRSHTHPHVPSTSASSSRITLQTPAYLHPPQPGYVPTRSHSTDYYTDSSNASAASSGGHPPQSTASSGSSHTSVRAEDWALTYNRTRPGALPSVSHDPLIRETYASSSRLSLSLRQESPSPSEETEVGGRGYARYKMSATRGTARQPLAQEGRESGLPKRQSRHTSISSASTSARDRSSSPVSAGLRTPSAGHPVSDQRSEQLRGLYQPHHRSTRAADELERGYPLDRSPFGEIRNTGESSQARSRSGGSASAAYFDASDFVSTSATETGTGQAYNAQRVDEYEPSGTGSSTNNPGTTLPWYDEQQAAGEALQDRRSGYPARGTSAGLARSGSVSPRYPPEYDGHHHYLRTHAHRSFTSPASYAPQTHPQLRGPGIPGPDVFDVSLPAPAPRDYTPEEHTAGAPIPRPRPRPGLRHATQPALSAPTPGYASNPAESFEDRVARRYPGMYTHAPPHERERGDGAGARSPAAYQDARRVPAQLETSAPEHPPAPYSFPPDDTRAHPQVRPRLSAPIPVSISIPTSTSTSTPAPAPGSYPGRPSPVQHEHESPSSAKRAKTKTNSSPASASSLDYREYMILSSSPTETTSGGGGSASARSGRPSSSRPQPQRASTSTSHAPADEKEKEKANANAKTATATGKRKKSSNSTSEAGRARAKGKMRARSPSPDSPAGIPTPAPAPAPVATPALAGPSTSGSRTSRQFTEEELAHLSALSSDMFHSSARARQFSDPTPSYHSATQTQTQAQRHALPRHQHEPAIESQLLHAPTPAPAPAPAPPQRTSTLDVQGEREPPPPYDESTAPPSARPTRARGKGKGKGKAKSKSKDSKSEKSSFDDTDSEYANSETALLDTKGEVGTGDPPSPRLFTVGARPPAENKRRGRVKIDVACEFCRKRKMRCDGRRPHCMNCITKERTDECVYVEVVRRRGPGKKPKGGRKIVKPKAIRELEEAQRKKDEAEARHIEAIRAAERERTDAMWSAAHEEVASILARQRQDAASGGSADPPFFGPAETLGGRLDLFPGISPLSPPVYTGPGVPGTAGSALSPPGALANLRLPFDSELQLELQAQSPVQMSMPIPVSEDLMDVRMASPPPFTSYPPQLPLSAGADMDAEIEAEREREEMQPLLGDEPRTAGDIHRGSLAVPATSRPVPRRARGAAPTTDDAEEEVGPWAQSTLLASHASSSSSSSSRAQTTTAPSARAVSASLLTRERPSGSRSSSLGRPSASVLRAQAAPSASASSAAASVSVSVSSVSASATRRTAAGAPLRTIPTPAQLLSATTAVGRTPSDADVQSSGLGSGSGSGSGSVPPFAPEQVEAFARRALGARAQLRGPGMSAGAGVGVSTASTDRGRYSPQAGAGTGFAFTFAGAPSTNPHGASRSAVKRQSSDEDEDTDTDSGTRARTGTTAHTRARAKRRREGGEGEGEDDPRPALAQTRAPQASHSHGRPPSNANRDIDVDAIPNAPFREPEASASTSASSASVQPSRTQPGSRAHDHDQARPQPGVHTPSLSRDAPASQAQARAPRPASAVSASASASASVSGASAPKARRPRASDDASGLLRHGVSARQPAPAHPHAREGWRRGRVREGEYGEGSEELEGGDAREADALLPRLGAGGGDGRRPGDAQASDSSLRLRLRLRSPTPLAPTSSSTTTRTATTATSTRPATITTAGRGRRPAIGQRRGRADAFGDADEEGGHGYGYDYSSGDAREGDPVSGERPSKRAKEDGDRARRARGRDHREVEVEGDARARAEEQEQEPASEGPASGSGARAHPHPHGRRSGWPVRAAAAAASPANPASPSLVPGTRRRAAGEEEEEGVVGPGEGEGEDAELEEGEIPEPPLR